MYGKMYKLASEQSCIIHYSLAQATLEEAFLRLLEYEKSSEAVEATSLRRLAASERPSQGSTVSNTTGTRTVGTGTAGTSTK